jgi:hypothetical protein
MWNPMAFENDIKIEILDKSITTIPLEIPVIEARVTTITTPRDHTEIHIHRGEKSEIVSSRRKEMPLQ